MRRPLRSVLNSGLLIGVLGFGGCAEVPAPEAPVSRTPPMARNTPPPVYPEALACDDIGGQSLLQVQIGPEGTPTGLRLLSSSGEAELDNAAIEAVRGWEFKPATAGGRPVPSTINVPVTFTPPAIRPERCFVLDEARKRGA